jgi:hypothetical protein
MILKGNKTIYVDYKSSALMFKSAKIMFEILLTQFIQKYPKL